MPIFTCYTLLVCWNILRQLFLSNIKYIYTCIVSHRCRTHDKNIDNRYRFVMLLNVSDLIEVILYWNTINCQIKKIYINTTNSDTLCSCIST